ncbi:MAG: hypothetical protein JSS51_03470 [Planctomycetes bacterium]|nr:hypothetical protein [Planctomycetota bacterium]
MNSTPYTREEIDGLRHYIDNLCCGIKQEVGHCESFGCSTVLRLLGNVAALEAENARLRAVEKAADELRVYITGKGAKLNHFYKRDAVVAAYDAAKTHGIKER